MRPRRRHRYYGQNGEDCLVWRFFDDKPAGFFVDVGAFDGIFLSNTKSFEEGGWRGVCVEAHPRYAALCRRNRPGSATVHAACVGDDRPSVTLRADQSGIYSGVAADEAFIAAVYAHHAVDFAGLETFDVPARRLDDILAEAVATGDAPPPGGALDLVSLDVEGSELDVLQGFDLGRWRPRLLVIEANTAEEKAGIDGRLGGQGYRCGRSIFQNHFYVRSAAEAYRLTRIEIDCAIEPVGHPEGYTEVSRASRRVWRGPEPRNGVERQLLRLRKHWRRWRRGRSG